LLFETVNALPGWLFVPVWLVMQLGSFAAIVMTVAVTLMLRRVRWAGQARS
jgi:hypothetical protein